MRNYIVVKKKWNKHSVAADPPGPKTFHELRAPNTRLGDLIARDRNQAQICELKRTRLKV